MTAAVWLLAGAIFFLAIVMVAITWLVWNNTSPGLTDEQIRERIAPCVAAELIVMAAQDADRHPGLDT